MKRSRSAGIEIEAVQTTRRGRRSIARAAAAVLLAAALLLLSGCQREELADDAPDGRRAHASLPAAVAEPSRDLPTTRNRPLLERVVVIGASVSAGFGTELPLAHLMDAAILIQHEPVVNASERIMGLNPVQVGDAQVNECLDHEATLVVALDFLFWFAYGVSGQGDQELERRQTRFQKGPDHLDRLACPVILGDIPNMRHKQRYITDAQVPSGPVLAALNAELLRFANARDNVILIPLDRWVAELRSGAWTIPNIDGPDGSTKTLPIEEAFLQDRLHPSRTGTLVLTDRLVEEMDSRLRPIGGASIGLAFDLARSLRLARR